MVKVTRRQAARRENARRKEQERGRVVAAHTQLITDAVKALQDTYVVVARHRDGLTRISARRVLEEIAGRRLPARGRPRSLPSPYFVLATLKELGLWNLYSKWRLE